MVVKRTETKFYKLLKEGVSIVSIFVAIKLDGKVEIHLPHWSGNYATACGLDGDDPDENQYPVVVPQGAKVNCKDCATIWSVMHRFRKSDFANPPTKENQDK